MFFGLPWTWRCFFASYHLIILPCHPIYKFVGLALSDHLVSVSHHHLTKTHSDLNISLFPFIPSEVRRPDDLPRQRHKIR
ncbi:hypothetical protein F4824DRAFT_295923 [Ustulina deusta]|nr:hypothetical protein F4824DRAFT_295923 [Ustulina deusta]